MSPAVPSTKLCEISAFAEVERLCYPPQMVEPAIANEDPRDSEAWGGGLRHKTIHLRIETAQSA